MNPALSLSPLVSFLEWWLHPPLGFCYGFYSSGGDVPWTHLTIDHAKFRRF